MPSHYLEVASTPAACSRRRSLGSSAADKDVAGSIAWPRIAYDSGSSEGENSRYAKHPAQIWSGRGAEGACCAAHGIAIVAVRRRTARAVFGRVKARLLILRFEEPHFSRQS
jgi:hypothetical protein